MVKLLLNNNLLNFFLVLITLEWLYIFEYIYNFSSSFSVIAVFRLPIIIYVIFLFWMYIWIISSWRRSLYGKFTRGEKKLWFKGLTAFWVGELATIGGVFIAACWMSWGPSLLIHRHFFISRKSFFIELTLFSYIVWLIYFLKFSLKWYLWKTQFFFTFFIIILVNYLIWRDFLALYTREPINVFYGSRWKYVKLNSLVYTMDSMWWYERLLGKLKCFHLDMANFNINSYIEDKNSLIKKNLYLEYDRHVRLNSVFKSNLDQYLFPLNIFEIKHNNQFYILDYKIDNYLLSYTDSLFTIDSNLYYPRRIGFLSKKITMWYFLFILKIWHHLMLFYWWFLYLLKIYTQKKASYTWLSACYFNVYCCFLIAILIYIYQYLPYLELYLKFKPKLKYRFEFRNILKLVLNYYYNLLTLKNSKLDLNMILNNFNDNYAKISLKFLNSKV